MNTKAFYKIILIIFLLCFVYSCDETIMYNGSEDLAELPIIEVNIDEDEYFNLLQNKTTKSEAPVKILYGDETSTGFIRSSGGGSRMHPRWNYRIDLNYNLEIEGLNIFSLSSQSLDPTMIHTTIVSRLYALYGIPIFRNKHIFLKINNRDKGLYLLVERIDEDFFLRRSIPAYEIYKANLGADLSFDSEDHPRFTYEKKLPEDNNYTLLFEYINVIDTCKIENIERTLSRYMDIDNYLQYHAMSSITNNLDAFTNNYYLHRQTAIFPYNFLPWDFDRAFDPEVNVGIAGKNTLFDKIILNPDIQEKYLNEVENILDNYFREDVIFPIIDSTASYIADGYNIDPFLGGGGYNLEYQVNSLKDYISDRIVYLRNNLEEDH